MNFDDFRKYMERSVFAYNAKRPHSSLNYMTLEEFESRYRMKISGRNGSKGKPGYKHVELLK